MSYRENGFFVKKDVLKQNILDELIEESELLKKNYSSMKEYLPHSKYLEVLPKDLSKFNNDTNGGSKILSLYRSKKLSLYRSKKWIGMIEKITNLKLHPMYSDRTNRWDDCKLNLYNYSYKNKIEWHYDRDFLNKGTQIVVVITLKNDINEKESSHSTLEMYKKFSKEKHKFHLEANSITVHNASYIIHKVPEQKNAKDKERTIIIMKYTTNPSYYNDFDYHFHFGIYLAKYSTIIPLKLLTTKLLGE